MDVPILERNACLLRQDPTRATRRPCLKLKFPVRIEKGPNITKTSKSNLKRRRMKRDEKIFTMLEHRTKKPRNSYSLPRKRSFKDFQARNRCRGNCQPARAKFSINRFIDIPPRVATASSTNPKENEQFSVRKI